MKIQWGISFSFQLWWVYMEGNVVYDGGLVCAQVENKRSFCLLLLYIWVCVKLIKEILIKRSKEASSHMVKCASTPLFTRCFVRTKPIRCFVPVITKNDCKYNFYFIAIFKSECWCLHANASFSGLIELFSVAAALNLSILPKMHRRLS